MRGESRTRAPFFWEIRHGSAGVNERRTILLFADESISVSISYSNKSPLTSIVVPFSTPRLLDYFHITRIVALATTQVRLDIGCHAAHSTHSLLQNHSPAIAAFGCRLAFVAESSSAIGNPSEPICTGMIPRAESGAAMAAARRIV